MKLRAPYFKENFSEDQPYDSLLLIAPYCDFTCEGCQNRDLFKSPVKDYDVSILAETILENPFVFGITIGGLEVLKSGMNFILDLGDLISLANVKNVTIYTRFTLEDLKLQGLMQVINSYPSVKNIFLKTGNHIENDTKKTVRLKNIKTNHTWAIELSSSNQDFLIFKSKEWTIL